MSRIIIIAIVVLICFQVKAQSDWIEYKTDQYVIKTPPSWRQSTDNANGAHVMAFAPLDDKEDTFEENVNLIIQDLSMHDLNAESYHKLTLSQINQMLDEPTIVENYKEQRADGTYQVLIYSATIGAYKIMFVQQYILKNKHAYLLTVTIQADRFEKYRETALNQLKNFNLVP